MFLIGGSRTEYHTILLCTILAGQTFGYIFQWNLSFSGIHPRFVSILYTIGYDFYTDNLRRETMKLRKDEDNYM